MPTKKQEMEEQGDVVMENTMQKVQSRNSSLSKERAVVKEVTEVAEVEQKMEVEPSQVQIKPQNS